MESGYDYTGDPRDEMVDYGENGTTIPADFMKLSTFNLIQIILAGIVFLLGLYGNYYVLTSVKQVYERNYSSMHHMLAYICYTEFLFILIGIPIDIAWRSSIGWYAGELECKIANFARCFIWFLSSLVLIFMSIDCAFNVFFPHKRSKLYPKRRVKRFIAAAFVLAFISASPKFYLSYVAPFPMYIVFRQCLIQSAPLFFSVYPIVESYFAPLVAVIVCYIPSFFRICRQLEKLTVQRKCPQNVDNEDETLMNFDHNQAEGVKLTFAIALVIILCYTPQIILIMWQFSCASFTASKTQEFVVYFTEMLKSVAIPVTYWIFHRKAPPEAPKTTESVL